MALKVTLEHVGKDPQPHLLCYKEWLDQKSAMNQVKESTPRHQPLRTVTKTLFRSRMYDPWGVIQPATPLLYIYGHNKAL